MELQEIIAMTRRLCEAPGTSGREDGAAKAAEELLAADPELKTCPAVAERIAELFAQAADTLN